MESLQVNQAIFVQILRLQIGHDQLWIRFECIAKFTHCFTILGCFVLGTRKKICELGHGHEIFDRQILADSNGFWRMESFIGQHFVEGGNTHSISRRSQVGRLKHLAHQTLLYHFTQ